MSIIFGFPNRNNVKVSDYLTAMGINLLRCSLSDWEAVVTVSANQPAYRNYTQALPAYMAAYSSRKRVSIVSPYHTLQYPSSAQLVLTGLPPVSVSFNGNPVTETLEAIRAAGGKDMKIKNQSIYIIQNPSPALLRTLINGGAIRTTAAATESSNIAALGTLSLVRRIFTAFLCTHQYPAFIDADHLTYNIEHWLTEVEGKRKRVETSDPNPAKRARTDGNPEVAGGSADIVMSSDAPQEETPSDTILYAIPPPVLPSVPWGNASSIPAGDGLFIRFVDETQNARGEKIIIRVLNHYFLGVLGNNAESVRSSIDRIKTDLGILMSTVCGRELAHLAKCISLGIQSQARIWPIIDAGQYLGCCLMGAGFQIAAYDAVYAPVNNSTLKEKVGLASSHRAALHSIGMIVSGDDTTDQRYDDVTEVSSMSALRELVMDEELSTDQRDQIVQLAKGLRFSPPSLHISAENLSRILTLIATPTAIIDGSVPIHHSMLFEQDRVHVLWSAFGELAPTFRFAGGPMVDLTRVKDLPTHLAVRNIALADAILDLELCIREKSFQNATANRRSGPFKDRIYTKIDARQILTALVSVVGGDAAKSNKGKDKAVVTGAVELFDDGF